MVLHFAAGKAAPRRVVPNDSSAKRRSTAVPRRTLNIRQPTLNFPVIRYPEELPICARREDILAALRGHQVLVVAGETGSGKTTQLPKMCLEAGLAEHGRIGCTQPRRVAAL